MGIKGEDTFGDNTARSHQMRIEMKIQNEIDDVMKERETPLLLRKHDKYNNFMKRDDSLSDSMSSHYFDSDRVETEILSQGISPTTRPPRLDKIEQGSNSDE